MVEDFVDLAKDINKQLCKYAEKQKNSQIRKMIEDVSFEISGFEDCSNNGAMRSFVIRSSNNNIECDVDYEDECDGFREYYSEEYEDYEEFVDSICEVVENIREFVDEKLFKETVTVELTGHGEAIIRNDNVYKEYSFIDGRIEEKKEIETTETIETLEKIEEPQEKVIKDDDSIAEFLKALGRPYDNEAVEKITIEDFMKCF